MNFLSADGFPITLDGVVEFRISPAKVAEMFVKYNETANGDAIDEEIIAKIIMPESRSLCRVGGSKLMGGQFISGDDRETRPRGKRRRNEFMPVATVGDSEKRFTAADGAAVD